MVITFSYVMSIHCVSLSISEYWLNMNLHGMEGPFCF